MNQPQDGPSREGQPAGRPKAGQQDGRPQAGRWNGQTQASQHNGKPSASRQDRWRLRAAGAAEFARQRLAGEFQIDESGFDPHFLEHVIMPLTRAVYRNWFRITMRGLENVPDEGAALVVANHSGVLPFDAIMLQTGLLDAHPRHRNLRLLGADLVYAIPGLATLAVKSGHTRADPAGAAHLLAGGELVGVFPEGFKGIGKPFRERYQLQRFGRGGFAATAIEAGVPIVPCAIVGAEEIYPMIGNARPLARILGLPYFPLTPLFPWLGPIGAIPLPSNWIIEFLPPVPTDDYPAGDQHAIAELSDLIRDTIQQKLHELVAERGPAFS
jgi:1-acyl-sn-glycerol-3-phosphate acyltransferase